MKKIVLSADSNPAIYLVPDYIADALQRYLDQFFDWLYDRKNDRGYWMEFQPGCYGVNYTEKAFIKWLNEFIIDGPENAILIEEKGH